MLSFRQCFSKRCKVSVFLENEVCFSAFVGWVAYVCTLLFLSLVLQFEYYRQMVAEAAFVEWPLISAPWCEVSIRFVGYEEKLVADDA